MLILGSSVTGGAGSVEAAQAGLLGYSVEVASDAQWAAKTAEDYASYEALILGDPTCSTSTSSVAAAEDNVDVWAPAVEGNVIIIGSDPTYHSALEGATKLIRQGIDFAADGPETGAYITLSCYYHFSGSGTPVPVLDGFGSFTVVGQGANDSHIVAVHPSLDGLTDDDLSDWGNSTHEGFLSWPDDFLVLAISEDIASDYVASDSSTGAPYILARGEELTPVGTENCVNGEDDDEDGLVDEEDPDCGSTTPTVRPRTATPSPTGTPTPASSTPTPSPTSTPLAPTVEGPGTPPVAPGGGTGSRITAPSTGNGPSGSAGAAGRGRIAAALALACSGLAALGAGHLAGRRR